MKKNIDSIIGLDKPTRTSLNIGKISIRSEQIKEQKTNEHFADKNKIENSKSQ